MKHLLGFRSIRQKISIGVLLTTFLALFISGAIIILYDLRDYQARTLEDLGTQADLIGQASVAALQFNDREVATQTLSLLRLRPQVITAAIYTANGEKFASYINHEYPDVTLPAFPASESLNLKADQISLPRPIMFENELLGHVYLLADYPYYQRLSRNIGIILGVTILALAISMLMSLWIQSRITRPIMNVTRLAHRVVEKQDYQSRAEKISDDEIGYLVDAFNNMLSEIEHRTSALERSNQKLNQEVDERVVAERALRTSERRHRTLLTALTSIVWQADNDGSFMAEQPQWGYYTGQSADQYSGQGWLNAFHEEDQSGLKKLWQNARDLTSPFESHSRLWRASSKEYRYVHLQAVPLLDDSGRPLEWMGIIDDIHEQVMSHQEIKRLNAELEQRVEQRTAELQNANKELEAFSYSVSHDLRAPLRSIDGFSQALLEDYQEQLDDTGRDYLNRVRGAAQRMGLLIDDLLKLSRVSRAEMDFRHLNLSQIAQTIVNDIKDSEPERQVSINIEPDISAYGDAQLMQVALQNLLHNAWKYSSKQREASIAFGMDTDNNGEPCYYIRDNGAGFDMAYAGRLFGAFQRLHDTRDFPGTGIGLATVQRILHRHGGHVWAEAEVDKGATFYFNLPVIQEISDEQQTYSVG